MSPAAYETREARGASGAAPTPRAPARLAARAPPRARAGLRRGLTDGPGATTFGESFGGKSFEAPAGGLEELLAPPRPAFHRLEGTRPRERLRLIRSRLERREQ